MDDADGHIVWFVVFLLCLTADFFIAAFAAGVQALSESSLENAAPEMEYKSKIILKIKDSPLPLICTCWLYLIITAWPAALFVMKYASYKRIAAGLFISLATYLLGRSVPRLVGKKYALSICLRLCHVIRGLLLIVCPMTWFLAKLTECLVLPLGIHPRELEDEVTEDEIISMVNEGHEQGVLDEHEAEMINNIFQLDDTAARDIMTHRKNISAIDQNLQLREAISYMVGEAYSRFPVYEENIDNMTGSLHIKDAIIIQNKGDYDDWRIKDIPNLLRPVSFIPETRNIDDLFHTMQKEKMHMVIVADEYGETAGLVTMEDILEEIVGNILDEYDEETEYIIKNPDGSFFMAGMTPIAEVEETLHMSFQTEDYDTLSGYLVYLLDRIPDEDDRSVIPCQGWMFAIEKVHDRMIQKVRVYAAEESVSVNIS